MTQLDVDERKVGWGAVSENGMNSLNASVQIQLSIALACDIER